MTGCAALPGPASSWASSLVSYRVVQLGEAVFLITRSLLTPKPAGTLPRLSCLQLSLPSLSLHTLGLSELLPQSGVKMLLLQPFKPQAQTAI